MWIYDVTYDTINQYDTGGIPGHILPVPVWAYRTSLETSPTTVYRTVPGTEIRILNPGTPIYNPPDPLRVTYTNHEGYTSVKNERVP